MNILITGATGFIGKALINYLSLKKELFKIYALSRKSLKMHGIISLNVDILDEKEIDNIFHLNQFDVVIHLAAITEHCQIVENKLITFDINLRGTINILNAFNRYCNDAIFIYSSTGKVYGKTDQIPITESALVTPQNILGKTKRITEEVIDFYSQPYNKYLIARIFNVYGENQKRTFVVPTIIDQLKKDAIILGNTTDMRDYIYIYDLVTAIEACINNKEKFSNVDYINIGSGYAHSVNDILQEIQKILSRTFNILIDERKFRKDETEIEYCDNHKLIALTGWKQSYSLHDGLYATLSGEHII